MTHQIDTHIAFKYLERIMVGADVNNNTVVTIIINLHVFRPLVICLGLYINE